VSTPVDPVDPVHAQCMDARAWVNGRFAVLQAEALVWDLRPCPPKEQWS